MNCCTRDRRRQCEIYWAGEPGIWGNIKRFGLPERMYRSVTNIDDTKRLWITIDQHWAACFHKHTSTLYSFGWMLIDFYNGIRFAFHSFCCQRTKSAHGIDLLGTRDPFAIALLSFGSFYTAFGHSAHSLMCTETRPDTKKLKKLKPDEFFMGKPSQNYAVPPKYGAHNFTCSPT